MKLFDLTKAGSYIWQVAEPKTSKTSYSGTNAHVPPPNAVYGHPIGRYDSDGLFWTFCPNAVEEDPNSPRSSRFAKHPQAEEERRAAVKAKVWGTLNSMGTYKETDF